MKRWCSPAWPGWMALACVAAGCGADAGEGFGSDDGIGSAGPISAGGSEGGNADGGDGGGGGDDSGDPPPEMEEEANFRVPRASGRWVYSASEVTNSVAVIDSQTLGIEVVGVGRGPTVVAPLAQAGRVAVLDQGSDDVALLRTTDSGTSVEVVPTSAGANNLAATPSGDFVFVYHDVDGPEVLGPGSDQEITIIEAATAATWEMTVGVHPREIVFAESGDTAYVVTDDGVNIVPLADLAMIGKPDLVPVVSDPAINPATLEIQVAANQGVALARVDGTAELYVTDLDTTEQYTIALDGVPTDLDVAADGSFAIVTLPSQGGSRFLELALPLSGTPTPTEHAVDDEYVGLSHLSPDGDTIILYTTVNPYAAYGVPPLTSDEDPYAGGAGSGSGSGTDSGTDSGSDSDTTTTGDGDGETGVGESSTGEPPEIPDDPRQRVTIARREGDAWTDQITLFVDRPVLAVGMAPDGENAMLLHAYDESAGGAPYSYTLLDLTKAFPVKKLQTVAAEPDPILFTPDGARAVVLLRDDGQGLQALDLVDLRTFIVEHVGLGSPPEGAGFVDATDKIFVSQEHSTGRISFIDAGGAVETVTGFRLNDAVKD